MKALRIRWAENQGILVDLGYRYSLPKLVCPTCVPPSVKGWGKGYIEYPCVKLDFLNKPEFNGKTVVQLAEFEMLRAQIRAASGLLGSIVPGGSIGELVGKAATRRLNDFIWGRFIPQISRRACDLLANEGITLLTGEMDMRCRGKKVDSYLAIQVPAIPLLIEESLKRFTFFCCPRCGRYVKKNYSIRAPGGTHYTGNTIVPEGYIMRQSAWPKGQHLVQSEENLKVFASNEFIEAVKKHQLTGITFIECGKFV